METGWKALARDGTVSVWYQIEMLVFNSPPHRVEHESITTHAVKHLGAIIFLSLKEDHIMFKTG